jgi:hypothetical protein
MRVYYLVGQPPSAHARIFHDLYTPQIHQSVREPFGPSDCIWLVPQTEASTENWLRQYVSDAVARNLCTTIGCTTCGADKFRWGLMERRTVSDPGRWAELLLDLMSELKPPEQASLAWERATRLMIFDCWGDLGRNAALARMQNRLGQSWAGCVLGRMIEHEEVRDARRRAHRKQEASSDPFGAQERRMQRKQERRLNLERRLLQKKERDKIWWANAANRPSNPRSVR